MGGISNNGQATSFFRAICSTSSSQAADPSEWRELELHTGSTLLLVLCPSLGKFPKKLRKGYEATTIGTREHAPLRSTSRNAMRKGRNRGVRTSWRGRSWIERSMLGPLLLLARASELVSSPAKEGQALVERGLSPFRGLGH